MCTVEHIPNESGKPFCGERRRRGLRFATEVTDNICAECLAAYRNFAQDAVEKDIRTQAWEWASYLLALPDGERPGTLMTLLKTLEIETRACLEGER